MDYGTILKNLKKELKKSSIETYTNHYGTLEYFKKLSLGIHRAFDSYCNTINIDIDKRNEFRMLLKTHCENYCEIVAYGVLSELFYALPDQFNVRGKWTSEYKVIE